MAKKDRESLRRRQGKGVGGEKEDRRPRKSAAQAEVAVGDYVRVRTIGKEGYVAAIDEQKRMAEIVVGNMRMRIKKDYVEKAEPRRRVPKEAARRGERRPISKCLRSTSGA